MKTENILSMLRLRALMLFVSTQIQSHFTGRSFAQHDATHVTHVNYLQKHQEPIALKAIEAVILQNPMWIPMYECKQSFQFSVLNCSSCTAENPLGCATLLPVKIWQVYRNIFRAPIFFQIFTGKSVAQQEYPFYYYTGTILISSSIIMNHNTL